MKKTTLFATLILLCTALSYGQIPEDRLRELGISLPVASSPVANYVKWRQAGNLIYLAGDGADVYGKLGKDLTIEQGYEAARLTAIEILATLKMACGDLSRIKQFVKVRGHLFSRLFHQPGGALQDHPEVINGFSDLIVDVFGEKGKHARAAVGQVSLPFNLAVEIEVIVELEE